MMFKFLGKFAWFAGWAEVYPIWFRLVVTLIVSAILIQTAVLCTTIYLHRTATHKALVIHPTLEWVFRFVLFVVTGLTTKEWVAVHLKHHAFTDKEGDPHSPYLMGFWSVQLGNVFHYIKEAANKDTIKRYAHDIREGWWDRHIFKHGWVGLSLGTVALCFLMGWWGLLAASTHAAIYVFVLSSSINGLCHAVGYKNFDNTATNLRWLGLFAGGEGYHNNHHEYPRSPQFSYRKSEFDPAWPVIKLLIFFRLTRPDGKTIKQIYA